MIRKLVALALVAAAALTLGWAANQPGRVTADWFGWTVAAHPLAALAVVGAAVLVALLLARLWTALRWRSGLFGPRRVLRRQRAARGYSAAALGALLAGQTRQAGKHAASALKVDRDDWTARSVAALAGDATQDERLRADPATALIAALAAYRRAPTRATAEHAAVLAPASAFAWEAALAERAKDGDMAAAKAALANWSALDPDLGDTESWIAAALDTAAADTLRGHGDRDGARRLYASALKTRPGFAPAAAPMAELLADDDRPVEAAQAIETAWRAAPHPLLARTYTGLNPTETQAERHTRVRRLVALNADHAESRLTLATHALAAGDPMEALETLGPLLGAPQPRTRAAQLAAQAHRRLGVDPPADATWLDALDSGARDPDWECRACHGHAAEWRLDCATCGKVGRLAWAG